MKPRVVDEAISQAWLEAGADLAVQVIAPFAVEASSHEVIVYEAYIPHFGGPKGTVTGVLDDKLRDDRTTQGYYCSNLAPSYRSYKRQYFIDTLNDWGWYGPKEFCPSWYTGKPWS